MRSVQKTRVKPFRLNFSTGGSSRKSRVFGPDPPVGILSQKKFSRKRPLSTDKSDCIRNGLTLEQYY